jgi:hypothetical protein
MENKPIYLWEVGNDDRPASEEDIKTTEKMLEEKIPDVKHIALPHTVRLMGAYVDGVFYPPDCFPLDE